MKKNFSDSQDKHFGILTTNTTVSIQSDLFTGDLNILTLGVINLYWYLGIFN